MLSHLFYTGKSFGDSNLPSVVFFYPMLQFPNFLFSCRLTLLSFPLWPNSSYYMFFSFLGA